MPSRGLLAWCENCQTTFVAGVFGGGGMALGGGAFGSNVLQIGHMRTGLDGVTISDTKTSCPTCGHMATIPDGLYDAASGVVHRGVDLLRKMDDNAVAELAVALRRRQAGEVDDQAVIDAAPNAEIKQWVRQILRSPWAQSLLGIVVTLIITLHQDSGTAKATRQILRAQDQTQGQIAHLEQQESQLQALVRQLLLQDQQAKASPPTTAPVRRPTPRASKRYTPPNGRRG